jgi:hypothetical protein
MLAETVGSFRIVVVCSLLQLAHLLIFIIGFGQQPLKILSTPSFHGLEAKYRYH